MTPDEMLAAMRAESECLIERARKADTQGQMTAVATAFRAYQLADQLRVMTTDLSRIWHDLDGIENGKE